MRIVFRGRKLNGNEWVTGYVISDFAGNVYIVTDKCHIQPPSYYDNVYIFEQGVVRVDPESVHQFTGLKDKNDRDIYRRDVVKFWTIGNKEGTGTVEWDEKRCAWVISTFQNEHLTFDQIKELEFIYIAG